MKLNPAPHGHTPRVESLSVCLCFKHRERFILLPMQGEYRLQDNLLVLPLSPHTLWSGQFKISAHGRFNERRDETPSE